MKRRAFAGLLALMLLLVLTACGGNGKAESTPSGDTMEMEVAMDAQTAYGGMDYDAPAATEAEGALRPEKMIQTATLELETTAFEEAVSGLARLTEELDGYYEYNSAWTGGSSYRWADYTVRVPARNYRAFLDQAGGLCHQISLDESQKNISVAYYDTEGRLKTQQIKLERLQALLAKAEKMEDIITIESAISETEQQIDDLSGSLRHYDDLVDYATVTISLREVYKLSNVEEVPDSFGSRIGSAFTTGWANFIDGLENLVVALAYGWMWVILLAVIVVVVIRVLRKRRKAVLPVEERKDGQNKL